MKHSFIIRLIAMAVVAGACYFFLMQYLPLKLQYHHYYFILFFFTASTIAFHFGLAKSAEAEGKHFIRYYMGATGFKLLLYVAIIVIYAAINKAGVMAFSLCFLLFYVLFTTFEVAIAYSQFGGRLKAPESDNEA